MRKADDCERWVREAVGRFGRLDILVNCAAGNFLVRAAPAPASSLAAVPVSRMTRKSAPACKPLLHLREIACSPFLSVTGMILVSSRPATPSCANNTASTAQSDHTSRLSMAGLRVAAHWGLVIELVVA